MFYDRQTQEAKTAYKQILKKIGALSNLFSDSSKPSLYYRAHENCFCKYFNAENLGREDCSADAKKGKTGIGLKTWVGSNIQKVAEFGKLRDKLENLDDDDLIKKVSEFRNERIRTTMNIHGLDYMIYHVIIREEHKMVISECSYDFIDIENIKRLPKKDNNNTRYFTDGKHEYNFNKAKTTLYMNFSNLELLDEFSVNIITDPYEILLNIGAPANGETSSVLVSSNTIHRQLALRLYTFKKGKPVVAEKSGLNQWNAGGRPRNPDEVYIPFNKIDRERPENKNFFPAKDTSFTLILPNNTEISAKLCQENSKAIMSNPNTSLGKWLLRDILNIPKNTIVTYEMLQKKGFDTVLFTKLQNNKYTLQFVNSRIYEELYNLDNNQ